MSDTIEAFNEIKRIRQEKKRSNLIRSIEILDNHGVHYQKLSEYHYRVEGLYDYWPSTGKFIDIQTSRSGRGVLNLLRTIRKVES